MRRLSALDLACARRRHGEFFFIQTVFWGLHMADRLPMTRKGYDKILGEIRELEGVEMPKIAQRIAEARSEGDLSENAEYHGARETQGLLQAKINLLKSKLANADIIDPATLPKDEVVFGCTVKVKDLDFNDEEEFTLVGAGEEDYDNGRILANSPLAQGLLGQKVGDKVEVEVPAGKSRFKILEIRWDD
jgi:transcription elongation factor GreA